MYIKTYNKVKCSKCKSTNQFVDCWSSGNDYFPPGQIQFRKCKVCGHESIIAEHQHTTSDVTVAYDFSTLNNNIESF